MKFRSLSPWLHGSLPNIKTLLLYGSNLEVLSFRRQLLQRIYKSLGYKIVFEDSWTAVLDRLQNNRDLFQTAVPYCISFSSLTESMIKEEEFSSLQANSPHFLILESTKLTSKSRTVSSFQQAPDRGILTCYSLEPSEILESLKWFTAQTGLILEPQAQAKLCAYLHAHIEEFFSLAEMLTLYAFKNSLSEQDIQQAFLNSSDSLKENISIPFFLRDLKRLFSYLEMTETTEWVGLIRMLLQDVMTLIALSLYKVSASALSESWKKGPIKFPYNRVSLYQSILSTDWSIIRGGELLAGLLKIEAGLKSSPSLSSAELQKRLFDLSMGRREST